MVLLTRIIAGSLGQLSFLPVVYMKSTGHASVRLALLKGRGEGEGLPLDKSLYERQTPHLTPLPFSNGRGVSFCPRSPAPDNQRTLALLHLGFYFHG